MNLDKLINFVGLVSVVLSLILVGVQISQNTNVSHNQAKWVSIGCEQETKTLSHKWRGEGSK